MYRNILKSRAFSILLVMISIAMMYIGMHRGEALVVMNKAIRVCMECIGIG